VTAAAGRSLCVHSLPRRAATPTTSPRPTSRGRWSSAPPARASPSERCRSHVRATCLPADGDRVLPAAGDLRPVVGAGLPRSPVAASPPDGAAPVARSRPRRAAMPTTCRPRGQPGLPHRRAARRSRSRRSQPAAGDPAFSRSRPRRRSTLPVAFTGRYNDSDVDQADSQRIAWQESDRCQVLPSWSILVINMPSRCEESGRLGKRALQCGVAPPTPQLCCEILRTMRRPRLAIGNTPRRLLSEGTKPWCRVLHHGLKGLLEGFHLRLRADGCRTLRRPNGPRPADIDVALGHWRQ